MSRAQKKPHINLVVIGHVDHGKSTMMGHFLYLMGVVDERTIEKYRKEAAEIGRESWAYAWILDTLKEERERGLTIDPTYTKFETEKYYFTLIDCPGHRDFIKNMISGTSQADAAVLVVSAKPNEFEAGFSKGGQTREHAILARILGIRSLIVCVNKMDAVDYKKEAYDYIKDELGKFLKQVGFNLDKIPFVPVSGLKGDNLTVRSNNMPWYTGPSLKEALDMYVEPPPQPIDKPLRIPIGKVVKITGVGTVATGRVATGVLKPGDKIVINPPEIKTIATSVEMHHEKLEAAYPGDNIGVNLKGVAVTDIKRGDVIGHETNPPTVVGPGIARVLARVSIIWHPTSIAAGYTPVLHAHTLQMAVRFVKLKAKYDPSGAKVEDEPAFIKSGDTADVIIEPIKKCVLEKAAEFPQLGRFAIRDMGQLIAVGVVQGILPPNAE